MTQFMCNRCAAMTNLDKCTTIIKADDSVLRFCPGCVVEYYRQESKPSSEIKKV